MWLCWQVSLKENCQNNILLFLKTQKKQANFISILPLSTVIKIKLMKVNFFTLMKICFFMKIFEIEKIDKTLNVVAFLIDSRREPKDKDLLFPDGHVNRTGHWDLLLSVFDDNKNDCLKPDYIYRDKILKYLTDLRLEYLNT